MNHLSKRALARLVDEPPEPDEARHLDACAECREMLERMRARTAALSRLPAAPLPPEGWERLRADLRLRRAFRARPLASPLLRAAAAMLLFLGGLAAGSRLGERRALARASAPGAAVTLPAPAPAADAQALTVRLAAIEGIVRSTQVALGSAPGDPVIRRFHESAVEVRRRLWQQAALSSEGPWF